MILSDTEILSAIEQKDIIIKPFDKKFLGSNSYDVHLAPTLATYKEPTLDAARPNELSYFDIPSEGYVLQPNVLYLGATYEYTEAHRFVPFLEGKSSTGRLGIAIHATAGKGDVGFCNTWTMEISVVQPVRIYALMPIAQLIYFKLSGEVTQPYHAKPNAKYTKLTRLPQESKMWQNFPLAPLSDSEK